MTGDGALFTREDSVEAAWAVVDPVLNIHFQAQPYKRGGWGPKQVDALDRHRRSLAQPRTDGSERGE